MTRQNPLNRSIKSPFLATGLFVSAKCHEIQEDSSYAELLGLFQLDINSPDEDTKRRIAMIDAIIQSMSIGAHVSNILFRYKDSVDQNHPFLWLLGFFGFDSYDPSVFNRYVENAFASVVERKKQLDRNRRAMTPGEG